jgi:hypothetical protein
MEPIAIGVGVLVLGVLVYIVYVYSAESDKAPDEIVLIEGSQSGSVELQRKPVFPLAFNRPEGLTYSYTGWILIKDFTGGFGLERRVMSKGDSPGLYLNSTSNDLMLKIDTFGSKETILIPNVPAMKWLHFAIVVDQRAVDFYINGILRQHHTLAQLPKQNDSAAIFGPGWKGVIGKVVYYARSLTPTKVKTLSMESPPDDLEMKPASGSYFDISWYIGRLNSV